MRRQALLMAGIVALGACHGGHHAAASVRSGSTTSTSAVQQPTVRVQKLTGGTTSPYVYDYTVDYPQLAGLSDDARQRAINAELARAASDLVGDFVAAATSVPVTTQPSTTSSSPPPSSSTSSTVLDASHRSELDATAETTLLDRRLASFRIASDSHLAGAADTDRSVLTFSYDLTSGRRLNLSDLFKPGSGYLDVLSRGALAQLAAMPGYEADEARAGTAPTDAHFSLFSLSSDALEITFAANQVGPTAFGLPRVTYPYAQLGPLFASPGPMDGR